MATVSPSDPLQDIAESGSLHIKEMERHGSSLFRVFGGHLFHNGLWSYWVCVQIRKEGPRHHAKDRGHLKEMEREWREWPPFQPSP